MKKWLLVGVGALIVLAGAFYALNSYIYNEKQAVAVSDYKNGEYIIGGQRVRLENGVAETEATSGSAKIVTKYFGNEAIADLNNDGRADIVFLLTQNTGGSEIYYYVVAAVNTDRGYVGSEAFLLGDRIAPQTTEISRNPIHKNVIVVNYAERAAGEPTITAPSQGKSVWLKLDPNSLQFGTVEQNFEGEADPSRMTLEMKKWIWVSTLYNDERVIEPKQAGKFTLSFTNGKNFSATTDCNSMGGSFSAHDGRITFTDIASTLMFCEGSQETEFMTMLRDASGYHFTSRGELILDLKFDSGSVTFR